MLRPGNLGFVLDLRLPVVLASASPRRRELLAQLIERFDIMASGVDEDALAKVDPVENAKHLACSKAFKVAMQFPTSLVIGADTVVAVPVNGQIIQFAKPADEEDAARMLRTLSGIEHTVVTGVSLHWPDGHDSFTVSSKVTFKVLSLESIRAYVATGEPLDKAGAYGAQAKGKELIQSIEGSITNVIGLPMEELEVRLRGFSRT